MTQALAIRAQTGATLTNYEDVYRLGDVFARSGYFQDARDAAQAIVKIMAGRELGLPPIASMTGIHVISGRITLGANLIASLIKKSGRYNYRVRRMDAEACEIEFFEGGESVGLSPFTIADARKAGTKNLEKFPRNMLFARAISNGARWFCPDIFGGPVYTPDELGAEVDEDGLVVNQPSPTAPTPARSVPPSVARDPERVRAVKEICSRLNAAGDTPPLAGSSPGGWKPATLNAYALEALGAAWADLSNDQLTDLGERLLGRLRAAEFDGRELADLMPDEIALVLEWARDNGEEAAAF